MCTTRSTTTPVSCPGILHQPSPDTFTQWKEGCIRTHSPPFSEQTLGFRTKFQLLVAPKLWSGKPRAKEKKKKLNKKKNISVSSHFLSEEWLIMLLFNRLFLTVGILFPRAMSYMHCITVTLCKCNQSQQHQELCLSRIWAEAAYPCSHEGLNPEASPT